MEPRGVSHYDECPLSDEQVDDDSLCICRELEKFNAQ